MTQEPLEVRLVAEVTSCRSCRWFWARPPYGPYPAFDFATDFPPQVRERAAADAGDGSPQPWLSGPVRMGLVDPQILHGCRKAPVMTIGINPNLTAFWPGTTGARWAYPKLSSMARYAYHYRHRTQYQESISPALVRDGTLREGAVIAEGAGRVVDVGFAYDRRRWDITVAYDEPGPGRKTYRVEWDAERGFVLLFDRVDGAAPAQFGAGDIIGGFLSLQVSGAQPLFSNQVGYYQRIVPVLSILEAHLRALGSRAELSLGEDVSQLDMVACASPGWGAQYEIDKPEVTGNCVATNAWAFKQLVQSRPAVIVFSGRAAFEMFHAYLGDRIRPGIDPTDRETYDLLATTTRWPYYLDIDETVDGRAFRLRSRIAIAPHFSYDDNFVPHTRFSPRGWEELNQRRPEAVAALRALGRIRETSRDGYVPVDIRGLDGFQREHADAMADLLRSFYEPLEMLGGLLVQEAVLGNLAFDGATRRLRRADGPCRFCVNGAWAFPEGCAYGKPDEAADPLAFLERVVAALTSRGRDRPR